MSELTKKIKGELRDLFNTRPRSGISKIGIALGAFNVAAGAVFLQPLPVIGGLAIMVACAAGDRTNQQTRPPSV